MHGAPVRARQEPVQEVQMGATPPSPAGTDRGADDAPSITGLLKRLGNETGELVRAEVALAKLEFRELARQAALDGMKVGAAAALAMVGVSALAAAGVLALGDVLGGRYAAAAAILGLVLLIIGGLLARSGIRGMGRVNASGSPLGSLRQKGKWAAGELRGLRQELHHGKPQPAPAALKSPEGRH